MKSIITMIVAAGLLTGVTAASAEVTEESSWSRTYPVQSAIPHLVVRNIWGSVRVRSGDRDAIVVTATERRSAPNQSRLERSLEVLRLVEEADASGVSLIVGERERWHNRNNCEGCRVDYQFDITVPHGTTIDVGTVMDGRVDVRGVNGRVSASNVNGPISLQDIHNCEAISGVNGRIDMHYSRAPDRDCRIETVNGDISLGVPDGTGLDMSLNLFNGEIESELQAGAFELPATVEHTVENGHSQYRIEKLSGVRIGAGGPVYTVASMNGDVRIRKNP